jgi:uncharacterized iron-regulated protein
MLSAALLLQAQVDPYLLDVHSSDTVQIGPGYTDTGTGEPATPEEIAEAARGVQFVFLGEQHATPAHHFMQAAVIEALVEDGRDVLVGLEMFTYEDQPLLDSLTRGFSREEFESFLDWEGTWGFPLDAYWPVFQAASEHDLPLVALNVRREDWTRKVARQGPESLTEDQKRLVPNLGLENEAHRALFTALIGGHPLEGEAGENMYAAQVLWDEAMAVFAERAMRARSDDAVMVVICGIGHMMYGTGINYRLERNTGLETLSVAGIKAEPGREVSADLADYVFLWPVE